MTTNANVTQKPAVALVVEDDGSCTPESFWPRLRKWIKGALRGYGLRVRHRVAVAAAQAAQDVTLLTRTNGIVRGVEVDSRAVCGSDSRLL